MLLLEISRYDYVVTPRQPTKWPRALCNDPLILIQDYSQDLIQNIPTSRTYVDIYHQLPGVEDGQYRELTPGASSINGGTNRDKRVNLEGANLNDALEVNVASDISYEIVEEVQVVTSGINAEFGGVTAGVVNVITKSGGNDFSGAAYYYYSDEGLQGKQRHRGVRGARRGLRHRLAERLERRLLIRRTHRERPIVVLRELRLQGSGLHHHQLRSDHRGSSEPLLPGHRPDRRESQSKRTVEDVVQEYKGLQITLEKRLRDRWQLYGSYTLAAAEGNKGTHHRTKGWKAPKEKERTKTRSPGLA